MGTSRQIGWGPRESLLNDISKQVEQLTKVFSRVSFTPPTPPIIPTLALTFDDISNADLLVGDSSNVTDWNTFFDLPTYGNPFTSVEISTNTVNLVGGSNITIKNSLFYQNNHLITVVDNVCVVEIRDRAFSRSTSLTSVIFPVCITTTDENAHGVFFDSSNLSSIIIPKLINCGMWSFQATAITSINLIDLTVVGQGAFDDCDQLIGTNINIPNLTVILDEGFAHCGQLTNINFPLVVEIKPRCFIGSRNIRSFNLPSLEIAGDFSFADNMVVESINIPSCTNLGHTIDNDSVFEWISGQTITLTIPAALMTCYGGQPDGDIQQLIASNTVTIIQV